MNHCRAAVLLYGPAFHHLDHLAPLSAMMQVPLIVTDDSVLEVAEQYYPQIEILFLRYDEAACKITEDYDLIFCCLPRAIVDDIFFVAEHLLQKRIATIWCPHGNSDKGKASYYMEALAGEKRILVYGNQMLDFLKEKKAFSQLKGHALLGNYRHQFYKLHKSFYDRLLQKQIPSYIDQSLPTIFYAPTWQDSEKNSSFFSAAPLLLEHLPDSYNLIIKPHPNLLIQKPFPVEQITEDAKRHPNVFVATEFAPIYPILEISDIYIGDMSSVGYDFLTYDRPMFFLNEHRSHKKLSKLNLHRCGVSIEKANYAQIFEVIKETLPHDVFDFSKTRKDLYQYTFNEEKPWPKLRQEIMHLYPIL